MLKKKKKRTPRAQLECIARHNRQGSYSTKKRYYEAMNRFCRFLENEFHLQNLAKINIKHLVAYVIFMLECRKSASTVKTDLSAIRFFHDKIDNAKFPLPDNKELAAELGFELERRHFGGVDRTWSAAEFDRMLTKAVEEGRDDVACAMYLARYCGLRIHEVLRMDTAIAERALREGEITIQGKGGKVRTVPVEDECVRVALRAMLDRTERGHKLFVPDSIPTDRAINHIQLFILKYRDEVADKGREANLTFHGLRHTYAAAKYLALTESGTSALDAHLAVSRLLGHERADVTNIYLASVKKEAR